MMCRSLSVGIEASLRRRAQYDYWSNEVKRSVLIDSGSNMLAYGNAERALAELAHRIAAGESITTVDNIHGTVVMKPAVPGDWTKIGSSQIDWPKVDRSYIRKKLPIYQ